MVGWFMPKIFLIKIKVLLHFNIDPIPFWQSFGDILKSNFPQPRSGVHLAALCGHGEIHQIREHNQIALLKSNKKRLGTHFSNPLGTY